MDIKLNAQKRETFGKKTKKLRKNNFIPAIIYGHGFKNIPLKVKLQEFTEVFEKAGESTIISLEIEGDKSQPVLIHDVVVDPVTDEILHIDFYRVKTGEKMTAEIPLIFEGEAPAVEDLGGSLITNLRAIEVRALPKYFPHDIKVNISSLKNFDDRLKVNNLPKIENVEILADQEEVVALIEAPRSKEEIEALSEEVKEEVSEVEGVEKEEGEETEAEEEKKEEVSEPKEPEEKPQSI